MENSIDAGADQIFVTVNEGGKALISVLDNGAGMSEEDARNSVLRHATSKLKTEEDMIKLAQSIAEECLRDQRVARVEVTVEKPGEVETTSS